MAEYRRLSKGEIIQEGDEVDASPDGWLADKILDFVTKCFDHDLTKSDLDQCDDACFEASIQFEEMSRMMTEASDKVDKADQASDKVDKADVDKTMDEVRAEAAANPDLDDLDAIDDLDDLKKSDPHSP